MSRPVSGHCAHQGVGLAFGAAGVYRLRGVSLNLGSSWDPFCIARCTQKSVPASMSR